MFEDLSRINTQTVPRTFVPLKSGTFVKGDTVTLKDLNNIPEKVRGLAKNYRESLGDGHYVVDAVRELNPTTEAMWRHKQEIRIGGCYYSAGAFTQV